MGAGAVYGSDASTNAVYGDYADPDDWGSGGTIGLGSSSTAGGGLVRIVAATLQLDGQVLANGGGTNDGGGGSGGGIYIAVTTLAGSGMISAAGGGSPWAGGGGGRIAVYAGDLSGFNTAAITALGGVAVAAPVSFSGGAGTVLIVQGQPHTHVRSYSPIGVNQGRVSSTIESVDLTFNMPLDIASFDSSVFFVDGQMGHIEATSMEQVGDRTYRFTFPANLIENGPYHFTLLPTLLDAEDYPLDQNRSTAFPASPTTATPLT